MAGPDRSGEERKKGGIDPAPFVINAFCDVIESLADEILKASDDFGPGAGPGTRLPRHTVGSLDTPAAEPRAARPFPDSAEPLLEIPETLPPWALESVEPPSEPGRVAPSEAASVPETPASAPAPPPSREPEFAPPPAPEEAAREVLPSPDDLEASVPDDLFGPPGAPVGAPFAPEADAPPEEGLLAPLSEEEHRTAAERIEASKASAAPLAAQLLAAAPPAKPPSSPPVAPPEPQQVGTVGSGVDVDVEMAQVESLIQGQLKQMEKVKAAEPSPGTSAEGEEVAASPAAPRPSKWNPFDWLDRKAVASGLGPLKPFLGYAGLGFLVTAVVTALSFWMYWKS